MICQIASILAEESQARLDSQYLAEIAGLCQIAGTLAENSQTRLDSQYLVEMIGRLVASRVEIFGLDSCNESRVWARLDSLTRLAATLMIGLCQIAGDIQIR